METMLPHLEILSRGLDELDDDNYVDFNVDQVPILMLYEQERHRYLMDEFNAGLISNNEYRIGSGRKETESDLADSLLANPNLIPIANTKKKMEEPSQAQVPGAPGQPGMPGMPPGAPAMPGMPPMPPGAEGQPPLDPNTMAGAIAEVGGAQPGGELAQSPIPGMPPGMMTGAEPVPAGATSAESSELMTKDALESQVTQNQEIERWEEILVRSMERVLERQQRVVLEKSSGAKAKKALFAGTLDIPSVLHTETWDRQFDEDIKPVVTAIVKESLKASLPTEKKSAKSWEVESDVIAQVESQMARIKSINQDLTDEITSLMLSSLNVADEDQRAGAFRSNIVSLYTNVLAKRIPEVASEEARRAWTYGKYIAR
jgi:hypothetical protein